MQWTKIIQNIINQIKLKAWKNLKFWSIKLFCKYLFQIAITVNNSEEYRKQTLYRSSGLWREIFTIAGVYKSKKMLKISDIQGFLSSTLSHDILVI